MAVFRVLSIIIGGFAPLASAAAGCQVTGDVLTVTTDIGGPILPGFGPTVFAEKAMAPTGIAAANTPPAAAAKVNKSSAQAAVGASGTVSDRVNLPQAVVDFLMPPQAKNPDIKSQVSY